MDKNSIEVFDILTGQVNSIDIPPSKYKYGGGDHGIMEYFVDLASIDGTGGRTSMESSLESHLIAFAAEESREKNIVVDLNNYRKRI